jgi:hypothetical protein
MNHSQTKRNLANVTDSAQSTITYDCNYFIHYIYIAVVEAYKTYTVTVQAKDASGNNRNEGEDIFWIHIENQCTKGEMFECLDVAGHRTVFQTEIDAQMTDNMDGTYSYTYTTQLDGNITLYVLLYTQFGAYAEFFNNLLYTGVVNVVRIYPQINQNWTSGLVTLNQSDDVSANYYLKVRAPVSDDFIFYLDPNHNGYLYFDKFGDETSTFDTGGEAHDTFTLAKTLDQNQFYDIKIQWKDHVGKIIVSLPFIN